MNKKIIAIIIGLLLVISIAAIGQLFNVKAVEVSYSGDKVIAADSQEIIALSEISIGQNIFTIDENVAEATIEEGFGNVLKVSSIERVFPNKVVIHIELRDLLFAVNSTDGETYITDEEFQVNSIKKGDLTNFDYSSLVAINGIIVNGSFNIAELKLAKQIISGMHTLGFDNAGVKAFIKSLDFYENTVTISLRQYVGTTITLGTSSSETRDMISTLSARLDTLYTYSDADRQGKTL